VAFLSLSPSLGGPERFFQNEDKVLHFITYAVAAILFSIWLGNSSPSRMPFWRIVLITSLYGIIMEILQRLMETGRLFDIYDIVANIFGAFAGTMLIYRINRSIKKNYPKSK